MGKSKYYSMDPFHEGGRTNGVNLKEAFHTIYQEMQKHAPGAVWAMQAWGERRMNPLSVCQKGVRRAWPV